MEIVESENILKLESKPALWLRYFDDVFTSVPRDFDVDMFHIQSTISLSSLVYNGVSK